MPGKNIIQFSLPSEILEKLEGLTLEDESLSLAAKRIFLEAIGEDLTNYPLSLKEILDRLEALETEFEALKTEKLDLIENPYNQDLEARNRELEKAVDHVARLEAKVSTLTRKIDQLEENKQSAILPQREEGLTSSALAKKIGVSKSTVNRWAKAGKFPEGWVFIPNSRLWIQKE